MYSVVMALALTTSAETTDFRHCGCRCGCYCGCRCGCYCGCGGCYCGGCYCGGCFCGCYGGCYCGGYCGCFSSCGCYGCFSCYSCYGCNGCYGGFGGCYSCYSCYSCGYANGYGYGYGAASFPAVAAAPAVPNVVPPPPPVATAGLTPQNDAEREAVRLVLAELRKKSEPAPTRVAQVTVTLPVEARLFIDNTVCPLTSGTRTFNTPTLEPGRQYFYTLRMEVNRDGQNVTDSRKVIVSAGQKVSVDFNAGVTAAQR